MMETPIASVIAAFLILRVAVERSTGRKRSGIGKSKATAFDVLLGR